MIPEHKPTPVEIAEWKRITTEAFDDLERRFGSPSGGQVVNPGPNSETSGQIPGSEGIVIPSVESERSDVES